MARDLQKYNAYRRKRYSEDHVYREKKKRERREYKIENPNKASNLSFKRKCRVLKNYGKGKEALCCWKACTVVDPDMLSLDHINNDGAQDRKLRGSGDNLYRKIEQENFPVGFQTLCYNHQWKKEISRRTSLRVQKYSR